MVTTSFDWTLFVSLQLLDIYTTYRGLKYDCVEETNHCLADGGTTVSDMALTKFAVLTLTIQYDRKHSNLNKRTIRSTNTFMALVIGNNMNVMHKTMGVTKIIMRSIYYLYKIWNDIKTN